MCRIDAAIVRAAVRGAAVRYGMLSDEYYREPGTGPTYVTRAQADRWRY
jgi:hypothetical protein